MTKTFDPNDMGLNFETNYYSTYGNFSYRILNPSKVFNSFSTFVNVYNQFNLETGKIQNNNISLNVNTSTLKNHFVGFGINVNPTNTFDYYETRTAGRFMLFPQRLGTNLYISTNFNNKFAFDFNPQFAIVNEKDRMFYGFSLGPRYRFSDKLLVTYNFDFGRRNNNRGFVDKINGDFNENTPDDIIFANRTLVTYANNLSAKYAVNSNMTFNLSIRQYWSYAENNQYLLLLQDGNFSTLNFYEKNKNSNFNSWNMDLSYVYWFAPGSQISVLYRNSSSSFERNINKNFGENIGNILTNDRLNHVLSVSVRYFIDFNQAKNWL